MEYISIQVTPTADGRWVAHPYIRATIPTRQGHPRVLLTGKDVPLDGLRGLDSGPVMQVLALHLAEVGTLPMCSRCERAVFGEVRS